MVKYEIRHSVANCGGRIENIIESLLSKHLFLLILPARFYRKRKSKLAIKWRNKY